MASQVPLQAAASSGPAPKVRLTRSTSRKSGMVLASPPKHLAPNKTKKALARTSSDPLGARALARVDENKTRQKDTSYGQAVKALAHSSQSTPVQHSDKPPGFLLAVRDGVAPLPEPPTNPPASNKRQRDDAETMLAPPRAKRTASTLSQFFALESRRLPSHLLSSTLADSPLKSSSSIPKSLNEILESADQAQQTSLTDPSNSSTLAVASALASMSRQPFDSAILPDQDTPIVQLSDTSRTQHIPSSPQQCTVDNVGDTDGTISLVPVQDSIASIKSQPSSPAKAPSVDSIPLHDFPETVKAANAEFPPQVCAARESPPDLITSDSDLSSEQDSIEPSSLSPTEDKADPEGFSTQQAKSLAKLQAMMTSMKVRRLSASQLPATSREFEPENAFSTTRNGAKSTEPRRARASTGSVGPKAAMRRTSVSAFVAAECVKKGVLSVGEKELEGMAEEGSSGQQAPLKGVVAFVDVRTGEGDDAGQVFADLLRELGAKVIINRLVTVHGLSQAFSIGYCSPQHQSHSYCVQVRKANDRSSLSHTS